MRRTAEGKAISLLEAMALLDAHSHPIMEREEVSLWDALGRVLAQDILAEFDQPPFPRSPLDGYALRSEDLCGAGTAHPIELTVIDEIMAGHVTHKIVGRNEAVRLMTGAKIPKGADCVIRQEDTDYGMDTVRIYKELKANDNYCLQGEDFRCGDTLLKEGQTLSAVEIGILASCGKINVQVYKNPGVAVITTGDETIHPKEKLSEGKIYDSNLFTVGCRIKEYGLTPTMLCHVEDDVEKMVDMIEKASKEADLIITTGGVSVGKKDIMHDVFEMAGIEQLFWRIAVKPGTPTLCGIYKGTLIISLSGNPFGALVNLELLARPVLSKMMHKKELGLLKRQGTMASTFEKSCGVTRYVKGYFEDGKVSIPTTKHTSGVFSSMTGCNCLIEVLPHKNGLRMGDLVWVFML